MSNKSDALAAAILGEWATGMEGGSIGTMEQSLSDFLHRHGVVDPKPRKPKSKSAPIGDITLDGA